MFAAFTVLFLLLHFGISTSQQCPQKEDMYPCICNEGISAVTVRCVGLRNISEIQTPVANLQNQSVSQFVISRSNLSYIPSDVFVGVHISQLDIQDSRLEIIGLLGDEQFKGQEESLKVLEINNCFLETAPLAYLSIGHLKKLSILNLNRNYIGLVHNQWFRDRPTGLKTLSFQETKIRTIGPTAFADLINLETLNMCRNEITYISSYMFSNPALHLKNLDFSFNKLSSLPDDLFSSMPELSYVNFELNEFTTLSGSTWQPIWKQIKYLNMEYNPLVCDSKIKWIYEMGHKLESKVVATCYKPFRLMDRELESLSVEELD